VIFSTNIIKTPEFSRGGGKREREREREKEKGKLQ
jgi:hypothetical protein